MCLFCSPTFVELRLQMHLDFPDVEECVRFKHNPYDAAERQEHSQGTTPGVSDETSFPPASDLPPKLYRCRGSRRGTRIRVGRAHKPAIPADANDCPG